MPDYEKLLKVAIEEARLGLAEGGVPVGACLADKDGNVLGRGHNKRVQQDDPTIHGETDAFKKAGRQRGYKSNIGTVVVGESVNFQGGIDWLRANGVEVIDLHNLECIEMMSEFIAAKPELWAEDIGE
jgi:creatinine deaminase